MAVRGIGRLRAGGGVETAIRALFAGSSANGFWYDPADLSTLFQDSAGATPVTAAGQPVGRMLDKSGRGNHRIQATAGSRPTLQQDANGLFYLSLDGTDDGMVTAGALDLTGTDKLMVWAGLRKNSDAAIGCFMESSVDWGVNNGTFAIFSPANAATANFRWVAGGTVKSQVNPTGYAAPVSAVLAGSCDIAADRLSLRINGAQMAEALTDLGTGNFGSHTVYFHRRSGTTLPFNGRDYGAMLLGAAVSDAQMALGERFIASRMGLAV